MNQLPGQRCCRQPLPPQGRGDGWGHRPREGTSAEGKSPRGSCPQEPDITSTVPEVPRQVSAASVTPVSLAPGAHLSPSVPCVLRTGPSVASGDNPHPHQPENRPGQETPERKRLCRAQAPGPRACGRAGLLSPAPRARHGRLRSASVRLFSVGFVSFQSCPREEASLPRRPTASWAGASEEGPASWGPVQGSRARSLCTAMCARACGSLSLCPAHSLQEDAAQLPGPELPAPERGVGLLQPPGPGHVRRQR